MTRKEIAAVVRDELGSNVSDIIDSSLDLYRRVTVTVTGDGGDDYGGERFEFHQTVFGRPDSELEKEENI